MDHEPPASPGRRPWVRPVSIGVAVLLGAIWWWWPALTRDPDRTDVMVVGTGEIEQADQPIQRRIREEGMSVVTLHLDPCTDRDDVLAGVEAAAPAVVVLAPVSIADCTGSLPALVDAVADAAGDDPTVLLAAQTGQAEALTAAAGDVTVVDPTRLLGPTDAQRMGCMWWDDCEPDGQVAVRDASGALTPAGGERVARVIAGAIP